MIHRFFSKRTLVPLISIVSCLLLEARVIDFFDARDPGANPDGYYSARN
jgi:hypothetical protein